jgi:U32 family peptidase
MTSNNPELNTDQTAAANPTVELLAPAGCWESAQAAVANGADAVYFGLQTGFNARARATNFSMDDLPALMQMLHQHGVRGYVTLNTLIFTDELPRLEQSIAALAKAHIDAVLVQDFGAARLIRRICPEIGLHASTQMSLTSAETIAVAAELGIERAVLARELSLADIRRIAASTPMPLEVFVHGALCVAYSGQCLTSESLGGRSANRGQCAQACRMQYDLLCDGKLKPMGDVKYLLSPQDLAAYELIPDLIQAGVQSLKIEGRLKTPEYVAGVVHHYRQAIDRALAGEAVSLSSDVRRELELGFSRGLSPGWLAGCDHKRLVPGLSSSKRGLRLGEILGWKGGRLRANIDWPLQLGDGIVLEGDRAEGTEVGGRVYALWQAGQAVRQVAGGVVEIALERGRIEQAQLWVGQGLWQTDDPQLNRRWRKTIEQGLRHAGRQPIRLHVRAVCGEPLSCTVDHPSLGTLHVMVEHTPVPARKHHATVELLAEQLGRLGNTPFRLAQLTADLVGEPMLPLSVLGQLRREMVNRLQAADAARPQPPVTATDQARDWLDQVVSLGRRPVRFESAEPNVAGSDRATSLAVLCRSLEQLQAVLEQGCDLVYVDFHDPRQYRPAVRLARQAGAKIYLASLRIFKPGERGLFLAMAKQEADGWLVRNLAAFDYATRSGISAIADFSLNVTNPLSAQWLIERGADRITASYDLNRDQLLELVDALPSHWLEIVIHQHMPMFHMEHCVFCSVLSPGTNKSNCGRPCDRSRVQLRDRLGVLHVLQADIGCRNTLYNGQAQSGAEAVQPLIDRGVRAFRVELLEQTAGAELEQLLSLYRQLVAGQLAGRQVWQALKADNRVGVTRGTLEQPRNPLAIL